MCFLEVLWAVKKSTPQSPALSVPRDCYFHRASYYVCDSIIYYTIKNFFFSLKSTLVPSKRLYIPGLQTRTESSGEKACGRRAGRAPPGPEGGREGGGGVWQLRTGRRTERKVPTSWSGFEAKVWQICEALAEGEGSTPARSKFLCTRASLRGTLGVRSPVKGGFCLIFVLFLTKRLGWTLICFLPKVENLCHRSGVWKVNISTEAQGRRWHTHARAGHGGLEPRKWEPGATTFKRMCGTWGWGCVWEFSACAAGSRGEAGERRPAVETARVPGMPRGGGVGSNEFEWGAAALSAPFSSDAWSHQSSGTEGITCASGAPRRDRAEKSPKNRQKIT